MWELQTPRTLRVCNKPVQGFALPSLLEHEWRNAIHLCRGYGVAWSELARTAVALSTSILLANRPNLAGDIAHTDKGISPDNWHRRNPCPCGICCAQITTGTRFPPSTSGVEPKPVVARSKTWVCGCSLAGIAGSNPARGMDASLLWVLCVVR